MSNEKHEHSYKHCFAVAIFQHITISTLNTYLSYSPHALSQKIYDMKAIMNFVIYVQFIMFRNNHLIQTGSGKKE